MNEGEEYFNHREYVHHAHEVAHQQYLHNNQVAAEFLKDHFVKDRAYSNHVSGSDFKNGAADGRLRSATGLTGAGGNNTTTNRNANEKGDGRWRGGSI